MNRVDRAKQFLPFDALKGLREELAKRAEKKLRVERAVLDESQQAEISDALKTLVGGGTATVVKYENGRYETLVCEVKTVDATERAIKLSDGEKIYFDDLFSVTVN